MMNEGLAMCQFAYYGITAAEDEQEAERMFNPEESANFPVGFEYGLTVCDCPFCGSAYVETAGYQSRVGDNERGFITLNVIAVWCRHCSGKGPQIEHVKLRHAARWAIRKWNCRQTKNTPEGQG